MRRRLNGRNGEHARTRRTYGVHRDHDVLVFAHQRQRRMLKAEGVKLPRQQTNGAAFVDRGGAESEAAAHGRQAAGGGTETGFHTRGGKAGSD
jgi:hypothetical protein